jgi:hypothetical protein
MQIIQLEQFEKKNMVLWKSKHTRHLNKIKFRERASI